MSARETFAQPRDQARRTARAFLDRWPAAAYMSAIETWRDLPGGEIEFTMRRLRTAIRSQRSVYRLSPVGYRDALRAHGACFGRRPRVHSFLRKLQHCGDLAQD